MAVRGLWTLHALLLEKADVHGDGSQAVDVGGCTVAANRHQHIEGSCSDVDDRHRQIEGSCSDGGECVSERHEQRSGSAVTNLLEWAGGAR